MNVSDIRSRSSDPRNEWKPMHGFDLVSIRPPLDFSRYRTSFSAKPPAPTFEKDATPAPTEERSRGRSYAIRSEWKILIVRGGYQLQGRGKTSGAEDKDDTHEQNSEKKLALKVCAQRSAGWHKSQEVNRIAGVQFKCQDLEYGEAKRNIRVRMKWCIRCRRCRERYIYKGQRKIREVGHPPRDRKNYMRGKHNNIE